MVGQAEDAVRVHAPKVRFDHTGGADGRIPTLEEQERDYIRWVLAESNGNQTAAAQALGIDRVSLRRKLKRFEAGP